MDEARLDKPREYFAKPLGAPDDGIDYSEIPATTAADWQDAEVRLPVTAEEFRAIQEFLRIRRRRGGDETLHASSSRR
jgi:hypothetical protein